MKTELASFFNASPLAISALHLGMTLVLFEVLSESGWWLRGLACPLLCLTVECCLVWSPILYVREVFLGTEILLPENKAMMRLAEEYIGKDNRVLLISGAPEACLS